MKRDKPTSPSVPFFAKHHEALHQAWVDRAQHEYRGTLPQAEQQIAALMAKGLSRKAAELEVAKAAAIAEDRKQRERDLAAAASVLATAKAMTAGAEARAWSWKSCPSSTWRNSRNDPLTRKPGGSRQGPA